jgi:hypothetical protein
MPFKIVNLRIFQSIRCQQDQEIMIFLERVEMKISDSQIIFQEKYQNKIVKRELEPNIMKRWINNFF